MNWTRFKNTILVLNFALGFHATFFSGPPNLESDFSNLLLLLLGTPLVVLFIALAYSIYPVSWEIQKPCITHHWTGPRATQPPFSRTVARPVSSTGWTKPWRSDREGLLTFTQGTINPWCYFSKLVFKKFSMGTGSF